MLQNLTTAAARRLRLLLLLLLLLRRRRQQQQLAAAALPHKRRVAAEAEGVTLGGTGGVNQTEKGFGSDTKIEEDCYREF